MNLPKLDEDQIAESLKPFVGTKLHVRSHSRFDPQLVWLVPSTQKPAYRFGKLLITSRQWWVDPSNVFCGFMIEKGLSRPAMGTADEMMDKTWTWHTFIKELDAELESSINAASLVTREKQQVIVAASMPRAELKPTLVRFEVDGDRLDLLAHQSDPSPEGKVLDDLAACKKVSDLIAALKLIDTGANWHWIDVVIGQPFTQIQSGPDQTEDCAQMLKAYQRWVK